MSYAVQENPLNATERRMAYINARLEGVSRDEIFHERLKPSEMFLRAKMQEIAASLHDRQKNSESVIGELIEELDSIDISEPAIFQTNILLERVKDLCSINHGLTKELSKGESSLKTKRSKVQKLTKSLGKLSHQIPRMHIGFPFEDKVFEFGCSLNKQISETMRE